MWRCITVKMAAPSEGGRSNRDSNEGEWNGGDKYPRLTSVHCTNRWITARKLLHQFFSTNRLLTFSSFPRFAVFASPPFSLLSGLISSCSLLFSSSSSNKAAFPSVLHIVYTHRKIIPHHLSAHCMEIVPALHAYMTSKKLTPLVMMGIAS